MNIDEFRQRLKELTRGPRPIADMQTKLSQLSTEYCHSIVLDEQAQLQDDESNCFMFAFDIEKVHSLPPDKSAPTKEFVCCLMVELTETTASSASDGDYVVYCPVGYPEHAGKWQDGNVLSKWGTGYFYKHGPLELPTGYGKVLRFFRQTTRGFCNEVFRRWAAIEYEF